MPGLHEITESKLFRLIGTAGAPVLLDLAGDPGGRLPGAIVRAASELDRWDPPLGASVVVACADGRALSPGVAAVLRARGVPAEVLEGGIAAWHAGGLPLIDASLLPERDAEGCTRWITRARPKVDRIACPWLIRRFLDPQARFYFVNPADVAAAAATLGAEPFDVAADGVRFSHRGTRCSFDALVEDFGLGAFPALVQLAEVVRGADTGALALAPEAPGLLALSLGLSRQFADDHAQLEAGMILYDAFYRWARDAADETHGWEQHQPRIAGGRA